MKGNLMLTSFSITSQTSKKLWQRNTFGSVQARFLKVVLFVLTVSLAILANFKQIFAANTCLTDAVFSHSQYQKSTVIDTYFSKCTQNGTHRMMDRCIAVFPQYQFQPIRPRSEVLSRHEIANASR